MSQEYRIKEVKVGFNIDSIETKYYPEVLKSRQKLPWLYRVVFGVKEKFVEQWDTFYENNRGMITTGAPGIWENVEIISFDNLPDATKWLQAYKLEKEKEQMSNKIKNKIGYQMVAVVIHPIN